MEIDEPVPADEPTPAEPTPVKPPVDVVAPAPAAPVIEETASNGNGHPREEEVTEEVRPSKRARREEETVPEVIAVKEPVVEAVVEESVPVVEEEVVEEVPQVEEEVVAAVVEEEEEPPVYNFEPEVLDLSTSDMYLDTVRQILDDSCSELTELARSTAVLSTSISNASAPSRSLRTTSTPASSTESTFKVEERTVPPTPIRSQRTSTSTST